MKTTRFMQALFSAVDNGDEELTEQVAGDIEAAKKYGSVDSDEVRYDSNGDGSVSITDKGTGEVTIAEKANDEDDTYDLHSADEQIEGYVHPEGDGVTPGQQVGAPDEDALDHFGEGCVISPNLPDGGLNPEAGHERLVEDVADEKEFSVYSDNEVVQRIFSDQEFCERIFAEVIDSEDTAIVGDLKVEKDPDEENTVIVTSQGTGDQAKIVLDNDEMEVTELESKNFSNEEQYEALHVVGVDVVNHVIVDAPEYDEESANELVQRLEEQGVDAVRVFNNPEEARDYAYSLLMNLGVETEDDVEEPTQAEFSDHLVYVTRYYSDNTYYMDRLFSEAANGIEASQSEIENAIEKGEEIESDDETITPIDATTAVVEDKESGEFTKVTLDGDEMNLDPITEGEAKELTNDIVREDELNGDDDEDDEDENDDDEDDDVVTNEEGTKAFSEYEYMNDYMTRLFCDCTDADECEIQSAIEEGEQVETDDAIITPVDAHTAVIEDKESGEFTRADMFDDAIDVNPISEAIADRLTEGVVADDEDNEDENDDEEDDDVVTNEEGTKAFSEYEYMNDYMTRLFTEDTAADENEIEDAIKEGEQVETDDAIITPVDAHTAVIEDKESGEYTKAEMDDDALDINAISEDEAEDLLEDVKVDDDDDVVTNEEGTKAFSEYEYMNDYMIRLFTDVADEDEIEDAIEKGEEIENDDEIITPIDATTAVIKDKESGEYTKAEINGETLDINPISEDEAKELTNDISVAEKKYSAFGSNAMDKFFAELQTVQAAQQGVPVQAAVPVAQPVAVADPNAQAAVPVDENGNPIQDPNAGMEVEQPVEPVNTVEEIEDKALQAVQNIQEVAAQASQAILDAKQAPVEQEEDLKEAQFSNIEDDYNYDNTPDTLVSWIKNNIY